MSIGFIGLGVMGRPMAAHLIEAGNQVYLHRVTPASQHLVEAGGVAAASARELAEAAEIVILMLPDTGDVETVLFGANGVMEGLCAGSLVIDMSSISPTATRVFAERVAKAGCRYLDAPVSGGEVGAKNATLSIMVGGEAANVEAALPLFEIMGKTITHVGGVGDGQTAKVANQIIVALTIQAVAEGLGFARAAGADPSKIRQALMGGFASSRILELHGVRMIEKAFEPGFRIRLHRKDLSLAVDGARQFDIGLPVTALVLQAMNGLIRQGDGELDHSALFKAVFEGTE